MISMSFEPYIFEEEPNKNKDKNKNTNVPRAPLQPFNPSPKKNYLNLTQNITQIIVNVLFILFLITSLMLGSSFFKNVSKQESNMKWFKDKKVDFTKELPNVENDFHGNQIVKEEIIKLIKDIKESENQTDTNKIPSSGILLYGPPGTGKTYLAKCLAGSLKEKASFFIFNGSDFVELYVGRGAARVRDAFKYAKKETLADGKKYCFIFIDEIDSIGRKRGEQKSGSSHLEQESTLNALLTEIDGFTSSSEKGSNPHVILIGATNRDDLLEPALIREGRLGKKIKIELPNKQDIKDLLAYFSQKLPNSELNFKLFKRLNEDYNELSELKLSYNDLALKLEGMQITPLEVNSLMQNIYEKKKSISPENIIEFIWDAIDTLKGGVILPKDNNEQPSDRVIFHELGHALVAKSLGWNVSRINVQKRGKIGGYISSYKPNIERDLQTQNDFIEEIAVLLGGRAAEEILLTNQKDPNNFSVGSYSDLIKAKLIATHMVKELGMSWPTNGTDEIETKIFVDKNEIEKQIEIIINNSYSIAKSILRELKYKFKEYINLDSNVHKFTKDKKIMNESEFNKFYNNYFDNAKSKIDYVNVNVNVNKTHTSHTETQAN
ncbi:AAA family ATPase ['Camptotheca acuminata' phytoplasma]|uniref:AAA family ATPase n=1 Tax='Camptotheca acuminata' phytoplasma TaxID=3239192 RepID=UPI003519F6AE